MKTILAWTAFNALLVMAHVVGAATAWAFGTLLLLAPELSDLWSAWWLVGMTSIGAAIAFLFAALNTRTEAPASATWSILLLLLSRVRERDRGPRLDKRWNG